MAAPPVGLDITPNALIAVALKRRSKGYALVRRAVGPLPPGVVTDGEVTDVERLAAEIKVFWEREGFREKVVNVGIANQRCITRIVSLPKIRKRSDLQQALSHEVAEALPIPLDEAVWDFQTVASYRDDDSGTDWQKHLVVMVYRDSVEKFDEAIAKAGLKLRRIDLAGLALMRAGLPSVYDSIALERSAAGAPQDEPPIVALCDIGSSSTNVVVARDGVCELNRVVSFGAQDYSEALAAQFGWSIEDAERVRMEAGIVPLGGVESPGDPYTESRAVLQHVTDQFAHELRTSLDYYHHSSDSDRRVERVVIAGEGALIRGIEQRFATDLGIPVSILDASPRLDPGAVEELGINHAHFGTALGLAIEEAA